MAQSIPQKIHETVVGLLFGRDVSEADIVKKLKQIYDEKTISLFPKSIFDQYVSLVERESLGCTNPQKSDLYFSQKALLEACEDIEMDLCVMLTRRKQLVGRDEQTGYPKLARGKIAGIATFRLARAPIIHLSSTCISCWDAKKGKPQCSARTLNFAFAIKCGLHFIGKKYTDIPKEVRKEILYTLGKRHTNQETLGIVFDAIKRL